MYKFIKSTIPFKSVCLIRVMDGAAIPFDPANTDYQTFKAQINADEAQLEDADGNLMTSTEAKAFVSTLP